MTLTKKQIAALRSLGEYAQATSNLARQTMARNRYGEADRDALTILVEATWAEAQKMGLRVER